MFGKPVSHPKPEIKDRGPAPYITDITAAALSNNNFRTTLWTGTKLQVTLMSIPSGGEVGKEIHNGTDQFLFVVQGQAGVLMIRDQNSPDVMKYVDSGYSIMVPAGVRHNIVNVSNIPLKLYSIYAPPHHPSGTVHKTKAQADRSEHY